MFCDQPHDFFPSDLLILVSFFRGTHVARRRCVVDGMVLRVSLFNTGIDQVYFRV